MMMVARLNIRYKLIKQKLMNSNLQQQGSQNLVIIKWLTFMMFMMFAMTTDAVGVIIPEVMKQFNLSMTAAGLMHYTPMIAIALAGVLLGFQIGRAHV